MRRLHGCALARRLLSIVARPSCTAWANSFAPTWPMHAPPTLAARTPPVTSTRGRAQHLWGPTSMSLSYIVAGIACVPAIWCVRGFWVGYQLDCLLALWSSATGFCVAVAASNAFAARTAFLLGKVRVGCACMRARLAHAIHPGNASNQCQCMQCELPPPACLPCTGTAHRTQRTAR